MDKLRNCPKNFHNHLQKYDFFNQTDCDLRLIVCKIWNPSWFLQNIIQPDLPCTALLASKMRSLRRIFPLGLETARSAQCIELKLSIIILELYHISIFKLIISHKKYQIQPDGISIFQDPLRIFYWGLILSWNIAYTYKWKNSSI